MDASDWPSPYSRIEANWPFFLDGRPTNVRLLLNERYAEVASDLVDGTREGAAGLRVDMVAERLAEMLPEEWLKAILETAGDVGWVTFVLWATARLLTWALRNSVEIVTFDLHECGWVGNIHSKTILGKPVLYTETGAL